MSAYRNLVSEGRIEFVTFHQSMSYEEFIEGLRPTTDQAEDTSADTGFRLEPVAGIFRRISERAEKGVPVTSNENALSLDGRQVFKMSIARANVASENYLFDEAISEGHTLLGWEDIDFTDDKFSDVNEILEACREEGAREGEVSLQSGQVSQVDLFRNQLEIGDIIVVTKGNSLFRAIGEVTGNYEYRQRDNRKYCHRRSVRWLWVDRAGVPASEIYDGNFTMRSIYSLNRARLTDASSKNGGRQSTEFNRSLPGIRRASGVRTIRPRSCVICVLSRAGRNETMTSARGQSQPVLMASFAIRTRTHVESCTRSGEM